MSSYLQDRAVLMKFSGGLPGQRRKDKALTGKVIRSEGLGAESGKWIKDLYPETALAECKAIMNEARAYHAQVTLPFGCKSDDESEQDKPGVIAGVGILPAGLIMEYNEKMRGFASVFRGAADIFMDEAQQWVSWAVAEHNGTFEPANYPGCSSVNGSWAIDKDVFRKAMAKKFYLRSEPLPVPDAEHFTESVTKLLGVDAQSVSVRVRDAGIEAQRELLRRMIEPVQAMATKLAEQPKGRHEAPIFRDSLVENVRAIAELAPKLNLSGDPAIDAFACDLERLVMIPAEVLRDAPFERTRVADAAKAMAEKMSAYKL